MGLGSINRALNDCAFEQNASLHQVTSTIDKGLVIDVEPFLLNGEKSYCYNENIAYQAGLRLLCEQLVVNNQLIVFWWLKCIRYLPRCLANPTITNTLLIDFRSLILALGP